MKDRVQPEFVRVRDLVARYPFSKSHVFALLRDGKLTGRKLGGVLFIDTRSVEKYVSSAQPWHPRKRETEE